MVWSGSEGATAVEYAIMVGLIAVVVIAGALTLGNSTNDQFVCTGSSLAADENLCD